MKLKLLFTLGIVLFFSAWILAHDGAHDEKKNDTTKTGSAMTQTAHHDDDAVMHSQDEQMQEHHESMIRRAELDEFPTLHPLVVHFPIVLLVLALFTQLVGLFVFKEQFSWATMFLLLFGFIGTLMAVRFVHPHTTELSLGAAWALEQHEKYADLTLYTSLIALIFKVISYFFLKRKLWAEVVVFVVIASSTYFISTAAHFGAQLTHIEGVGPQGHYLEMHEGEHSH